MKKKNLPDTKAEEKRAEVVEKVEDSLVGNECIKLCTKLQIDFTTKQRMEKILHNRKRV